MATLWLIIAMFLNPLGFDVLFKMVLDATKSYWATSGIFYCASALCFGLYFYSSRTNPFEIVKNYVKFTILKIKRIWKS